MTYPHAIHDFFLYNNKFIDTSNFSHVFDNEGLIIYDVLRVMNGAPLFIEDHLHRLGYSATLANVEIWKSRSDITSDIARLIDVNNVKTGNIRVVFQFGHEEANYAVYFVKHAYPSEQQYKNGVPACLLRTKRNMPNAKIQQDNIRREVARIIDEKKIYEVLLVDDNNTVREGSKSNLFFVRENQIFTCPTHLVLNGITMKCLFQICDRHNINIRETEIKIKDLVKMESAFITGTSPKILPLHSIEQINFDVNSKLTRDLMYFYDKMIAHYLSNFKL
jgi:branched-chain amino acid aminotransferase